MDAVDGPNAAVLFTMLVGLATAVIRYLLGIIAKQEAQLQKSNEAISEAVRIMGATAEFMADLLKENLEWKQRYEKLIAHRA